MQPCGWILQEKKEETIETVHKNNHRPDGTINNQQLTLLSLSLLLQLSVANVENDESEEEVVPPPPLPTRRSLRLLQLSVANVENDESEEEGEAPPFSSLSWFSSFLLVEWTAEGQEEVQVHEGTVGQQSAWIDEVVWWKEREMSRTVRDNEQQQQHDNQPQHQQ